MKPFITKSAVAITALVMGLAILGGCSKPYSPQQEDGWCAYGREWVKPAKNAAGEWEDGYCRYKTAVQ